MGNGTPCKQRQTDTTENIIFPQICCWKVTNTKYLFFQRVTLNSNEIAVGHALILLFALRKIWHYLCRIRESWLWIQTMFVSCTQIVQSTGRKQFATDVEIHGEILRRWQRACEILQLSTLGLAQMSPWGNWFLHEDKSECSPASVSKNLSKYFVRWCFFIHASFKWSQP